LYSVKAYYDKELKKGRKKTEKYLGRIIEHEGLVEPTQKRVPKSYMAVNTDNISTKDYGLWAFIQSNCQEMISELKQHFPKQWEWMVVALYCRLVHTSPLKNMSYYYKRCFISEELKVSVTSNAIATLLKDLGANREPIVSYFKALSGANDLILMDATSIVSYSENLTRVEIGLTKYKSFEPIFNLLYFYSPDNYMPAYYRLFNGNLKDVTMVSTALRESGYTNALVVADKGFYSQANIKLLEEENLKFIIPLRRNSKLIKNNRYKQMLGSQNHFFYERRLIHFDSYKIAGGKQIYLYIDEPMMLKEKSDYIHRMTKSPGQYSEQDYKEKLPKFGSFAVISNQKEEAEEIFLRYKSRCGVEVLFDGVKNILGNDHTYMQNDEALEGWMFINHLALQVHHKIYSILKEKKLLSKYSIRDFISFLADIRKVKINDEWVLEPTIDKQKKLMKELGVSIT
ncbi:MAG: transposase, partial [Candidatus Saccharimonadales bacterium]